MDAALLAIVVIIAIVRGIYLFFRWATRSLKRLGEPGEVYAPPKPMSPPQASPPSPSERGQPAPMPRPPARNTLPPPVTSREATTPGLRNSEAQMRDTESQSISFPLLGGITPSTPPTSPALFGNASDLVRALILQEALGPPLSKRRRPPH